MKAKIKHKIVPDSKDILALANSIILSVRNVIYASVDEEQKEISKLLTEEITCFGNDAYQIGYKLGKSKADSTDTSMYDPKEPLTVVEE